MGEGNRLNIRKSSCQWDVFGCEIFSQGKEVKASLFGSRAGQNCFWSSSSGSGGGGEKSSSCAWRSGRYTRGSGWMYSEKEQEEQGRLKEEWCTHRHEGHNKRSNRGAVGISRQKQERKQGKQRGKEAGAAESQDRKEWWEMLREALQGARVQGWMTTARSGFCFVNSVALAKQS